MTTKAKDKEQKQQTPPPASPSTEMAEWVSGVRDAIKGADAARGGRE